MKARHIFIIAIGWIVLTFALHCWVLYAIADLPSYDAVKRDSAARMQQLNRTVTSPENAQSPHKQALEKTELGMLDNRLFAAFAAQENAEGQVVVLAANGSTAGWHIARRAWVSWIAAAIFPVVGFVTLYLKTKVMGRAPQQTASPNAGSADVPPASVS